MPPEHPSVLPAEDVGGDFEDGSHLAGVGTALEEPAALVPAVVKSVVRAADEAGPPPESEVDRTGPEPFPFEVRDGESSGAG